LISCAGSKVGNKGEG